MKSQYNIEFLDYLGETKKAGQFKTAGIKDAFSLLALAVKNEDKICTQYNLPLHSVSSHMIVGEISGQQEVVLRSLLGHPLNQPSPSGQMTSICSRCKKELIKTWHILVCDERETAQGNVLPKRATDAGLKIDDFILKPAHMNPTQKYVATICPSCFKIEIFENTNGWYVFNSKLTKLFN